MNLGKMGIQICEKLRENRGWRQIGLCHKWDSKAHYWAIRGPELHAYSTQSVNQSQAKAQRQKNTKRFTIELKHFALSKFHYLFWPVSQQIISLICSITESWFSPVTPLFSALCKKNAELLRETCKIMPQEQLLAIVKLDYSKSFIPFCNIRRTKCCKLIFSMNPKWVKRIWMNAKGKTCKLCKYKGHEVDQKLNII